LDLKSERNVSRLCSFKFHLYRYTAAILPFAIAVAAPAATVGLHKSNPVDT
jgi:hypothetical protein